MHLVDMDNQPPWHNLPKADVVTTLGSHADGLSASDAEQRLSRYGLNEMPVTPPPGFWRVFFRQFISPLIYVLLAAMLVSLLVGELTDAGFIGVVLLVNALIGAIQEYQAHKNAAALRNLIVNRVQVRRDGYVQEIPSERLVPGDCVLLSSGERVPA
ncbi:MAG TPA: cation-transporting P-type ATPase, partial [Gammaproteobacteria bacterium]|nr:cation-transporting P-type ATPase [Gammaproteobacteria bacterium]